MNAQFQGPEYRMAWEDPSGQQGRGTFLFDTPEEARDTRAALIKVFPMNVHWLEDRTGQRVEIPA